MGDLIIRNGAKTISLPNKLCLGDLISLRDVTTKDDLNEMTKALPRLLNIVAGIVKKLICKFESLLEKKMNEKIKTIQNELEEKVEALNIENEDLKKRLEVGTAQITSIKKEFSETVQVAKQANMSSNYNEPRVLEEKQYQSVQLS